MVSPGQESPSKTRSNSFIMDLKLFQVRDVTWSIWRAASWHAGVERSQQRFLDLTNFFIAQLRQTPALDNKKYLSSRNFLQGQVWLPRDKKRESPAAGHLNSIFEQAVTDGAGEVRRGRSLTCVHLSFNSAIYIRSLMAQCEARPSQSWLLLEDCAIISQPRHYM